MYRAAQENRQAYQTTFEWAKQKKEFGTHTCMNLSAEWDALR